MYNGIGLSTTRGSGTNGYVQRNLSTLRSQPQRVEFSRDEKKGSERSFTERKPDPDILLHNKKRQIEVQCLELRDELEGQGLSESEIEDRIESLRTRLLNELVGGLSGTDNTNETHAMAEAKERQNVKLMQAFGIHEASYTEGAAFDRELQEKKKAERAIMRESKERELNEKQREEIERRIEEETLRKRNEKRQERELKRLARGETAKDTDVSIKKDERGRDGRNTRLRGSQRGRSRSPNSKQRGQGRASDSD